MISKSLRISDDFQNDVRLGGKNGAALVFATEIYLATVLKIFLAEIDSKIAATAPKMDGHFKCYHYHEQNTEDGLFPAITKYKEEVRKEILQFVASQAFRNAERGLDLFGELYRNLIPAAARKQLGEFYTPAWLAEQLLDLAGFDAASETRLLDPACGSGTFLLAAVRKMIRSGQTPAVIAKRIAGFDLNPLAVLMTTANLAVALHGLKWHKPNDGGESKKADHAVTDKVALPMICCYDSICCESPLDFSEKVIEKFDWLVGNPPWLNWDKLPAAYREKTKPLWERYGLFSLSGKEARYGGAKKELAQLMIMTVSEHFLKPGGKLAMVVPQPLFQTQKSGNGFRCFGSETGPVTLKVLRVDDFSDVRVFSDATVKTATLVLENGGQTEYPVPYYRWSGPNDSVLHYAVPVSPQPPGAAWQIVDDIDTARHNWVQMPSDRVDAGSFPKPVFPPPHCQTHYRAMLGANTGGANGIYWVELQSSCPPEIEMGEKTDFISHVTVQNLAKCGKKEIPTLDVEIESGVLFPLLRWKDVQPFAAVPSAWIILVQDVQKRIGLSREIMMSQYPKTLEYLGRFETELRERAAYRKYLSSAPFYSMYNISTETLSAIKVVWRRMDTRIRAAVVRQITHPRIGTRPVIPQETCSMIAVATLEEANYLAAVLNSDETHRKVSAFSVQGGKGFGSPGILEHLQIPPFDPQNASHLRLSQEGRDAGKKETEKWKK
ncbi:MAG: SAM-dependent methyltransferase [Planctomycetaceae bacterium]|nr:SAM-dependent methyltransferase [Planctomycetaceae bacterium]